MEKSTKIYEKLNKIQEELKCPKKQYNNFGKYSYRSCEDILESVKPICKQNKTVLTLSDEIIMLGARFYVKATASLLDLETGEEVFKSAYAREDEDLKGMTGAQLTGATSSYARKYALNGLFCIDDTKDFDTDETTARIKNASEHFKTPTKPIEIKATKISKENLEILNRQAVEIKNFALKKYQVSDLKDLLQKDAEYIIKSMKEKGTLI